MSHAAAPRPREGLLTACRSVLELAIVSTFAVTFVLQPLRIPSESMLPTLHVGDFVLADKLTGAPAPASPPLAWLRWLLPPGSLRRGDLVVFHYPPDPAQDLVKRVIGMPGDRVRLHRGRVWINGVPLAEPYAFYSEARPNSYRDEFPWLRAVDPNVDPAWWFALRRQVQDGAVTVPAQSYFVLGDNRNNSEDSRYWGFVPAGLIVGRPWLVYFSPAPHPASGADAAASSLLGEAHLRLLR